MEPKPVASPENQQNPTVLPLPLLLLLLLRPLPLLLPSLLRPLPLLPLAFLPPHIQSAGRLMARCPK